MSQLIILAGASGAGKSTLARNFCQSAPSFMHVEQDRFCLDRSHLLSEADFFQLNHESPDIIDHDMALAAVRHLLSGHSTQLPIYEPRRLKRLGNQTVQAENLVFEGLHAFFDQRLLSLGAIKIFIDVPTSVSRDRRIHRDSRSSADALGIAQYIDRAVHVGFSTHVSPLRKYADYSIDGTDTVERNVRHLHDLILQ
jgi:uridine kinase